MYIHPKLQQMEIILDFLMPVIPAFLVFATAWIFFDRMRKDHRQEMQHFQSIMLKKESLPLRLKALERLTIMLERIKPSSIVLRAGTGNKRASTLQFELLTLAREEFEHNVSLQLYVSPNTWTKIQIAKKETDDLIKVAATKAGPEADAMALSRIIFDLEERTSNTLIKEALHALKQESDRLM